MNRNLRSANMNLLRRGFKMSLGLVIASVLVNLALLALGVWVVVSVLQWMGVI